MRFAIPSSYETFTHYLSPVLTGAPRAEHPYISLRFDVEQRHVVITPIDDAPPTMEPNKVYAVRSAAEPPHKLYLVSEA